MGIVTRTPKEQEEYGTTGYPKEKEDDKSKVSGLLGGLLGMGTSVAGMIPSLLKGPQNRELKKIQAGGGAGAAMARQTGSEAAARIVGASTAQPSSGRGGALREGLRAADQVVQRGAQQAAITGAREGLAATQMLRGNELQRRAAFKTLGAGVGQGLAGIGGMLAASRDQGPPEAQAQNAEQIAAQSLEAEELRLQAPAMMTEQQQILAEGQQQLTDFQNKRAATGVGMQPTQEQGGPELRKQAGQPTAQAPAEPAVSEQEIRAQQLANLQSINQQAARDYISSAGTPEEQNKAKNLKLGERSELPPSMGWPESVQDYLYNQADNYAPMLNQGMDPQEVAKLLIKYEFFPIDWMRLGITEWDVEKVAR
jgi:hypothetical protein